MEKNKVPYVNFNYQTKQVKAELMEACSKVLDNGMFILGSEVQAFETEIAQYCHTKYAVGVSNGTSALILALRALDIGPGDEVITAPNSFIASASAIALVGATPVFADISENLNLDPSSLEKAITSNTKAIMPVHLTGLPAPMKAINAIAKKHKLLVIEDAAQSIGAEITGQRVGSFGDIACFSLHPLKNLHAFGDAGFISTNSEELVEKIKTLRNLGLIDRDTCQTWSTNDRLDELQAAMLRINLKYLDQWTNERLKLAFNYNEALKDLVQIPKADSEIKHVYQTYVILTERRDELMNHLIERGVEAKVHYPKLIVEQPAADALKLERSDFPISDSINKKILSLPLYPGLSENDQAWVIESIKKFFQG